MSETNVQNYRTKMNATINEGWFKNNITHKRHTTASIEDIPTHGTEHADAKPTLPDVPAGTNGEIYVMLSSCDVEEPPKLMDPKLKIGKTLNQPLLYIGQSEYHNKEKKLSLHVSSDCTPEKN